MKKIIILILPFFVLALMSCSGSGSKEKTVSSPGNTDSLRSEVVTHPRVSLPDTTGTVKGYETHKFLIPVESDGVYSVTASSRNTGLVFVIQDAQGKNVTNETSEWQGELKKGDYTLIVGLTRNAARKNLNDEVKYTVKVEREK